MDGLHHGGSVMSATFNWKSLPSTLAPQMPGYRKPDLEPKRYQTYQSAKPSDKPSDESREAEISQTNREVERHFNLAQTVEDEDLRVYHRDEARRLASKVRYLVALRSAAYVAQLEQERGIA